MQWLTADHLGSASATYRADNGATSPMRYMPWGEQRDGSLTTRYTYTGQYSNVADFGLLYYNARWYDPALGRFAQADFIIPEAVQGVQAWDRFAYSYSYSNPVKYIDPDGHWPCSFSDSGFTCSTFGLGDALNRAGESWGVENASDLASDMMATFGVGFDIAAEAFDIIASAVVTTGIVIGATGGAAITIPGGGTAVVTGAAGASLGWATAEVGVHPLIKAGNALAAIATGFTLSSELISGDTGFEYTFRNSADGVEISSQVKIGSASQVSTFATAAGFISPLAYPSLAIQTTAILGDLGIISRPPINIGLVASLSLKPKVEFRLQSKD